MARRYSRKAIGGYVEYYDSKNELDAADSAETEGLGRFFVAIVGVPAGILLAFFAIQVLGLEHAPKLIRFTLGTFITAGSMYLGARHAMIILKICWRAVAVTFLMGFIWLLWKAF